MLAELMFFGGAFHRAGGNIAASDGGLDGVEISRAHEGLVLDGTEAHRLFHFEFVLLQLHKSRHAVAGVAVREFEHAGIERVEASQCDELEFVTHLSQLFLERGDLFIVEFALPVEGGRAVVGQHLAWIFFVDGFRKFARFIKVGCGGFAPDQVHIRSEFESACHGIFEPVVDDPETVSSAFASQMFVIDLVNIAADEVRAERIGAANEDWWARPSRLRRGGQR
jgi:hypothetical protein